mmetsp:Transcript_23437/g.51453  ORF Transcript_23437/g.51453 Transcript_23437/m.51453 type:complete len:86 (+) Transcript_23437:1-258(+)
MGSSSRTRKKHHSIMVAGAGGAPGVQHQGGGALARRVWCPPLGEQRGWSAEAATAAAGGAAAGGAGVGHASHDHMGHMTAIRWAT